MKTKLANTIDNFFIFSAITIFIYIWSKNIIKVGYVSIIISVVLGLAISKILISFKKSKNEKTLLNERERRETKKLMAYLLMLEDRETSKFFKSMFEKNFECKMQKSHLEIKTKSSNILVFWNFKCETTRIEDLARCENQIKPTSSSIKIADDSSFIEKDIKTSPETIKTKKVGKSYNAEIKTGVQIDTSPNTKIDAKNHTDKNFQLQNSIKTKIFFFSHSFSEKALLYAESKTRLLLFDDSSTYTIAKKSQSLPDLSDTKIENPFKIIFQQAVSSEKSKKYFFAGVFLLAGSFLLPYSIYYKIFASLLFLLSILCLAKNPRFKKSLAKKDIIP